VLSTPIPGKKKGKKAKRCLSGVGSTAALSPVKENKTDLDSVHAAEDAVLSRHPRAAALLAKATKLGTVRKIGRILDAKRASRKARAADLLAKATKLGTVRKIERILLANHNPDRPISTSSPDHPIFIATLPSLPRQLTIGRLNTGLLLSCENRLHQSMFLFVRTQTATELHPVTSRGLLQPPPHPTCNHRF
jgi:hypothetical protein